MKIFANSVAFTAHDSSRIHGPPAARFRLWPGLRVIARNAVIRPEKCARSHECVSDLRT
jgi:hypothetical protein